MSDNEKSSVSQASNTPRNGRQRRHFTGQQKVALVKQHLLDGRPVSDLCDEHGIQPTQFYLWQKQLFEQGAAAFERKTPNRDVTAKDRKISQLEAKITDKNEVIAELMEENVKAKKECGEL